MNNVAVTPEILEQTSTNLSNISSELKNCFDRINASIEVIRTNWTDANGRQFSGRFDTEVKPKLSVYYNSIATHSKYIGDAAKIYRSVANEVHSSVA